MPCWELFAAQDEKYRRSVLPAGPAGRGRGRAGFGWERWLLGERGSEKKAGFVGMTGFSASGPIEAVYPHFGIYRRSRRRESGTLVRTRGSRMAWKTLDDIDLQGKVVRRGSTSTCRSRTARSPMRRGSSASCRRSGTSSAPGQAGADGALRPAEGQRSEMSPGRRAGARGGARSGVAFAEDCVGPAAGAAVAALPEGGVLLLENLRFHKGEEANDPSSPRASRSSARSTVNDAFSPRIGRRLDRGARRIVCLRRAADAGRAGALEQALGKPERPVVAVVGGAKVSTKLELLGNLIGKVDTLVIGGGWRTPSSRRRDRRRQVALRARSGRHRTRDQARRGGGCAILLPSDAVVARESRRARRTRSCRQRRAGRRDDPRYRAGNRSRRSRRLSVAAHAGVERAARRVRDRALQRGTDAVARQAAELTAAGKLLSVAGGGDTVAALTRAAWRTTSPTSRRRAARSSNGSRARNCPASPRSTNSDQSLPRDIMKASRHGPEDPELHCRAGQSGSKANLCRMLKQGGPAAPARW